MGEMIFAGKTVVITGAGRGLGFWMARRFGQAGAHTVIAEINSETGARAAEMLRGQGLSASCEPLDVRDPAQSGRLVDKLFNERGRIDVWINNAGVSHVAPAESHPRQLWDDSISVMLSGVFYCSQAVGPKMLAQGGGVIVNVASAEGYKPIEGRVAYSVAKAGVIMLTQALGIEWARRGVRVVGIAPAVVMTDVLRETMTASTAAVDTYQKRTPLRRLGTVEEVAEAVLYLASDEASYIVAETLRVDGGWVAYSIF